MIDCHNHFFYLFYKNSESFCDLKQLPSVSKNAIINKFQQFIKEKEDKKDKRWIFGINFDKLFTFTSEPGDDQFLSI